MKLVSSNPFPIFHYPLNTYHTLEDNINTQVLIIGGGISGALCAHKLLTAGYKVCLITDEHVGTGSTSASTSLLQYDVDIPLHKLIKLVGRDTAEKSFLLGCNAIEELKKLHKVIGASNLFQSRKSLLLASRKRDVEDLKKEFEARKGIGLDVLWLNDINLISKFGVSAAGAIYSAKAGQTEAYPFTQMLIAHCVKNGLQVFDKTEAVKIEKHKSGCKIYTKTGYSIQASDIVIATGYDTKRWLKGNYCRLHSTFVILSEPFKKNELWKDNCLIWDTGDPYLYMRVTRENRVILGGKDEPFASSIQRDALIKYKSKQLLAAFHARFPHLHFKLESAWAGTFAETPDGLPYIGRLKSLPHVYFALGYGGNGITYSQIAANIITDSIAGKKNDDIGRFGFNRKKL